MEFPVCFGPAEVPLTIDLALQVYRYSMEDPFLYTRAVGAKQSFKKTAQYC